MKINYSEIRSFLIITLGLTIYSFGWTAFLIPSGMIGGGVTGIGTLIYYGTEKVIPVGYSYFILNAILILIALKILGSKFGVKTIFAMLLGSILLSTMQKIFTAPLVDEKFMAAIIGGVLSGTGIGLTISQGGSSGGTDIIAMIINKYRNISPGRIILYLDVFIIASSYLVFHDVSTIVYGYVVMSITSYSIDMVISGSKQSAQLFIVSSEYEKIADKIANEMNRGVSMLDATGWYSKESKKILMVVVRKHEAQTIFRVVKQMDEKAFISMGSVMGVYGLGFDEIRA
ncbi:YitT family protein [Labilibaculum sp.]|uniref:YitT family protein n=1 Tax=Labilibaculum sp. TaxID=2060723 RepID=UPI00356B5C67